MTQIQEDDILMQATLDFGVDYYYEIKKTGLGLALVINAVTKRRASELRKRVPGTYEGLYTMVTYNS